MKPVSKKKMFAQETSHFKANIAKQQKTLLSDYRTVLSPKQIVLNHSDFDGGAPRLIVIFGTCLTAVRDAGLYLQKYYNRCKKYPRVICLPGLSSSKYIKYGMPIENWMKVILMQMGIPKEVVKRDVFDFNKRDVIDVLRDFLKRTKYKNVLVFSSRGYSVNTALTLMQEFPEVNFKYFDNAYIKDEDLNLDAENLDLGYGLDLLLGEIVRLNLNKEKFPNFYLSENLMTLNIARKFIEKGYVLGLRSEDEWRAVGIDRNKAMEMIVWRMADFDWMSERRAFDHTKQQIHDLLKNVK